MNLSVNGKLNLEGLAPEELSYLYFWLFTYHWQSDPSLPLIAAGLRSSLPAKLYQEALLLLEDISNKGQIIIVNLA